MYMWFYYSVSCVPVVVVLFIFCVFGWFSVLVPTMSVTSLLECVDYHLCSLSLFSGLPRWHMGFSPDALCQVLFLVCILVFARFFHLDLVWTVMVGQCSRRLGISLLVLSSAVCSFSVFPVSASAQEPTTVFPALFSLLLFLPSGAFSVQQLNCVYGIALFGMLNKATYK